MNKKNIKLLNEQHDLFIKQGALARKRLRESIARAIKNRNKHYYIFSDPGLGKTTTTEDEFKKAKIEPIRIEGNNSLWGFATDMAQIIYNREDNQHIFVFIDDCDNLLLHNDSVNTLKISLAKGMLNYNKPLAVQYTQLEESQKEAIDSFRKSGYNGFQVPLKNMTIIWCSNYKLATQKDTNETTSDTARQKYIDEEALRRRFECRDYEVKGDVCWGWIADCVLNETPQSLRSAHRKDLEHILFWMHSHWKRLKEHNISFAEKLYGEILENPSNYATAWEMDYLIDNTADNENR
jgi:hypothetical protein